MKGDWDAATIEAVRSMAAEGLTGPAIAAKLPGLSRQTVQRIAKRFGIELATRKGRARPLRSQSGAPTDEMPRVASDFRMFCPDAGAYDPR